MRHFQEGGYTFLKQMIQKLKPAEHRIIIPGYYTTFDKYRPIIYNLDVEMIE